MRPCKQLTPALERAAEARAGKVELAKVDVEKNPRLQAAFRIQGIPSVKAFRDGRVAAEFTGALPPAEVERFFDALVPSEADELGAQRRRGGAAPRARAGPEPPDARAGSSASCCSGAARRGEATELLEGAPGDFVADGLLARAAWRATRSSRRPSRPGTRATAARRSSGSRRPSRRSATRSAGT